MNNLSVSLKPLTLALAVVALAGCQNLQNLTKVDPVAPTVDLERQLVVPGEAQVLPVWSNFYTDQRLVSLIELTLENNRDLEQLAYQVAEVQANYNIVEVSNLPSLTAGLEFARQGDYGENGYAFTTNTSNQFSASLALSSYEIDFWGRIKNLKQNALSQFLASQSAQSTLKSSLISQLAQSWTAYSYTLGQIELAQKTLDSQNESLSLNQQRFEAGIDSSLTVAQAKTQVAQARLALAENQTTLAQLKNTLDLLAGVSVPADLLPGAAEENFMMQLPLTTVTSQTLLNRPDVRQAELSMLAAGANIGAARAAYYPNISLYASTSSVSTDLDDLLAQGTFNWGLGAALNLPIFDFGRRKANLEIARAQANQSLVAYEQSILTALKEVSDAAAFEAQIDERLDALTDLVDAVDETYRLSNLRYKAGLSNYLNVLDAQRSAFSSEQQLLALQQSKLVNRITTYQVLGGGSQPDEFDPNRLDQSETQLPRPRF